MQKKYVKYNGLMAMAILFVICFQSLHIFTDEIHHSHCQVVSEDNSKTHFSLDNKDDCPVCDFQFAAFLSAEIFTFDFINPQHKFLFSNVYKSFVKEKEFLYFSHRGPPTL